MDEVSSLSGSSHEDSALRALLAELGAPSPWGCRALGRRPQAVRAAAEAARSQPGPGPRRGKVWPEGYQVGTEDQPVTRGWSGHMLGPGHQGSGPSEPTARWQGANPAVSLAPWGLSAQRSRVRGTPRSRAHEATALTTQESCEGGWGSSSGHTLVRHGAGHGSLLSAQGL